MDNGKAQILREILRIKRPFKAATLAEMTQLSRQLCRHHLMNFVNAGWVEKRPRGYYHVTDESGLLDSLFAETEKTQMSLPKDTLTFEYTSYNKIARSIVNAKTLGFPLTLDTQVEFNRELDEIIAGFKQIKKWINNTQSDSKKGAWKWFRTETTPEKLWDVMLGFGMNPPDMTKQEWLEEAGDRMDEI